MINNSNNNSNQDNLNNQIPKKKSKFKKFLIAFGTILGISAVGLGIRSIQSSKHSKKINETSHQDSSQKNPQSQTKQDNKQNLVSNQSISKEINPSINSFKNELLTYSPSVLTSTSSQSSVLHSKSFNLKLTSLVSSPPKYNYFTSHRALINPFVNGSNWFDERFFNELEEQIKRIINKKPRTDELLITEKNVTKHLQSIIERLSKVPDEVLRIFQTISSDFKIDYSNLLRTGDLPFHKIKDSKLRSSALTLINLATLIKKRPSVFKTLLLSDIKNFKLDIEEVSEVIPHFKRTNNQELDQYITLLTLEKTINYLKTKVTKINKNNPSYWDNNAKSWDDINYHFNINKYYSFWLKLVSTYIPKKDQKPFLKALSAAAYDTPSSVWVDNVSYSSQTFPIWKPIISQLIEFKSSNKNTISSKIIPFLSQINRTEYYQSKNNIKPSLKAISHFFIASQFKYFAYYYFSHLHMFDYDLLESTLIDYIPRFFDDINKLDLFDKKVSSTIKSSINHIIQLTEDLFTKTKKLPSTNLSNNQKNQTKLNDLQKQFSQLKSSYHSYLSHSKTNFSNQGSKILADLKKIYHQLKKDHDQYSTTSNKKPLSKIKQIQQSIKDWKHYLFLLFKSSYPNKLLKSTTTFNSLLNQLNELKTLSLRSSNQNQYSDLNNDNFLSKWNDFLLKAINFDIWNKNINFKKLFSDDPSSSLYPYIALQIDFERTKRFKFIDNNITIELKDIDLSTITKNNIKLLVSSPYDLVIDKNIQKVETNLDGSQTTITFELILNKTPLFEKQTIIKTLKLTATSEKLDIFKKIKEKQQQIENLFTDNNITSETMKNEFQDFKSIWDNYQTKKMSKFDNKKQLRDFEKKLKELQQIENQFKEKYAEYLIQLKKKLIERFKQQYDNFINEIDKLKEKKFKKTISSFKAKNWIEWQKQFNVYSQKKEFINSLSKSNTEDFSIASHIDMQNYLKFLEDLNTNLQNEIERINKLFDISDLKLNLPITNQTPKEKLIEAFKNEIPKELNVQENIDFQLEIKYANYGILGEIKFIADDSKNKLVGELLIPISMINKDISKIKLGIPISNSTKKEDIIATLIKKLGFEVIENVDFKFFKQKSTKTNEGFVLISSQGLKITGQLQHQIQKISKDDISDLIFNLDFTKPITKPIIKEKLIEALGYKVDEWLDYEINIKESTSTSPGLITITTTNNKITGKKEIVIPQKNQIDLSKLELDIKDKITLFTRKEDIIESFNKALGFIPTEGNDYALILYKDPTSWTGHAIFFPRSTIFESGENKHLKLDYNQPQTIDISKLIWTKRVTNHTPVWEITEEFIALARTSWFQPEPQYDFTYEIKRPTKQKEIGTLKFIGKGLVLQNQLEIPIFYTDQVNEKPEPNLPVEDNSNPNQSQNDKETSQDNNSSSPIETPPSPSDPNFIPKIIGGTLTGLIFLAVILSVAIVFIKKHRNRIKLELSEEDFDNDEDNNE